MARVGASRSRPYACKFLSVSVVLAIALLRTSSNVSAAAPPDVTQQMAYVGRTAAILSTYVNPRGLDTAYRIEWGASSAYGTWIPPVGESSLGSGVSPVPASAEVHGLDADTTYHFRVVATNSAGTTVGADHAFTTPNRLGLPDNRAFELVSPADKRPIGEAGGPGFPNNVHVESATDGNSFYYIINSGLPDSTAGGNVGYVAERTSAGWQNEQVSPPVLSNYRLGTSAEVGHVLYAEPRNLACTVMGTAQPLTADTPRITIESEGENLYQRTAGGIYKLLSTTVPANLGAPLAGITHYSVAGASADCSHIFFSTRYRLLPEAPPAGIDVEGVYEWVNGVLRYAGVLPDGSVATDAAAGLNNHGNRINSVSPDGSHLFFSATSDEGDDAGHLAVFMRVNGASTIDISQSQTAIPNDGKSTYQMASDDGSHVFFLAKDGLASVTGTPSTCGAPGGSGCHLYSYNVGSGVLDDLSLDPDTADTEGPGVYGVADAASDGSTVYFIARGQMVPGAGKTFTENVTDQQYSLFRWHLGQVSYLHQISDLDARQVGTAEPEGWTSRATADGSKLLFVSSAGNPTGVSAGQQAYLYSDDSETTWCISCPADGQMSLFNTDLLTQENERVPGFQEFLRYLSDNGRGFFTSRDALVPGVVADTEKHLYEWEEGNLYVLADAEVLTQSGGGGFDWVRRPFQGASASGDDVFIQTHAQLAPEDFDAAYDIYDLRVGGGFSFTPPEPPCDVAAGECQGPGVAPPPADTPASESFVGPENPIVKPMPRRCRRMRPARRAKAGKRCHRKRHHSKSQINHGDDR